MNLKSLFLVSLLANLVLAGAIMFLASTIARLPDTMAAAVIYPSHIQTAAEAAK